MRTLKGLAALLAVGLLAGPMVASASIVYQVNENFSGGSVTGTVTTDGTLGIISTITPFVDWNLTLSNGVNSSILSSGNSSISFSNTFNWIATASDLTFDHTFGSFFLFYEDNLVAYWCLEGPGDRCSGYPSTSNFTVNVNGNRSAQVTSDPFPATVFEAVPAPVPLPAAAWLLLSGLGGLGFMARRRKAA